MKLQVSFDILDIDKAIDIATGIAEYVDIIEVGTLLIYKHGTSAIEQFKAKLPKKTILADTKIVDRGKDAASLCLNAGADWVTVMAGTGRQVIQATCFTAHNIGKRVMLDLLDASSIGQSAMEAEGFGIDTLLFHQPHDNHEDSLTFLDQWDMVKGNTNLPIFISAHISRENIHTILPLAPDGIVVGSSIVNASDPVEEAKFYKELISK